MYIFNTDTTITSLSKKYMNKAQGKQCSNGMLEMLKICEMV